MNYLIIKTNGNGYHCGCCRREYTETETMSFENDEAAIEYAKTYNANDGKKGQDSLIDYIYPVGDCIYEF